MQAGWLDIQKEKSQLVGISACSFIHYLLSNVQRDYIKDLESRLAAEDEENAVLSRKLAQMETAHKQTMERNRDALFRAAKKYGVVAGFLKQSDPITRVASPRSNPSWTI